MNEIGFLLDAAKGLRDLAETTPEVAIQLRRLADELEAVAAKLKRSRHGAERAEN